MSLRRKSSRFGSRRLRVAWRDLDEPIRAELFSLERLEQHARSLAEAQRTKVKRRLDGRLRRRLRDNNRTLLAAYRAIAAAIREERAITPAAEWLVDNFHVVEDQIRELRDDLPQGFYRQLPKLVDGPLAGYPQVFGLAWAFVAHTDSHFDPQTLCPFVRTYQRVQPLTIGELWAVPIALRLVLVENLRRCAERIISSRSARQEADALADRLLGTGGSVSEPAAAALRPLDHEPLPPAFAMQLVQRLRDQDPTVTPALRWLDERLASQGTTADVIVREEHQRQVSMNVTVRNIITSMRLISAVDWAEIFESVSLVDAALRAESEFAAMDFSTRDCYRHAIEALARGSGCTELEVTHLALHAARRAASEMESAAEPRDRRRGDPGYYLIAAGRDAFERALAFRPAVRDWPARISTRAGLSGYLATIVVGIACLLTVPVFVTLGSTPDMLPILLLGCCALVPVSDAAIALVNFVVTNQHRPYVLPGMELRDGVPTSLRTLVAVPIMLTSHEDIDEHVTQLEVRYLASGEGDLYFALLSDWTDSGTENAPGDTELLATAVEGIRRLNRQHDAGPGGDRFLLLHRRRVWNAGEGEWIGWERKRGKLHELNRLLRGATDTTYSAIDGRPPVVPTDVRYVMTLDADTRLPRGAARRLVGKLAHPLNHPRLDPDTHRVVEGYAVLQPRVTSALPFSREGSLLQRVLSGPGGIDPYAFAVSDVYQDLFGEGSYTGKGIYDVDMFEAALVNRLPESCVLSHDLLEGTFARAGLVSDIEVIEEFPSRYDVLTARQHRWARGDWQLLPWIFGRGRDARSDAGSTAIPLVGRWKMLDNLRRTLSAPAALSVLVVSWTLPIRTAAVWTAFLCAMIAVPPLLPVIAGVIPRRLGISKRSHVRALLEDTRIALSQTFFCLTLLAHQAWLMADAISRTLFRLFVRRRLLEWVTAAQAKYSLPLDVGGFYRRMAGGIGVAVAVAVIVAWSGQSGGAVAAPFLLLWISAPAVAQWASRPPAQPIATPTSVAETSALRLIGRRTWRFFETFVTAEDHMLPPDNFQEDPSPVVAHRTSPTNVGLYLLSVAAARHFHWIGTVEMVERLEATLATLRQLDRFRGHFYNWYDTRDLRPLDPKYVSSVDSGNLAGHLVALANACEALRQGPPLSRGWFAGIDDVVALNREALYARIGTQRAQTVTRKQLEEALDLVSSGLRSDAGTVAEQFARLSRHADTVTDIARTLNAESGDDAAGEVLAWAEALSATIRSHTRDAVSGWPGEPGPSVEERLTAVAEEARRLFDAMEFGFLLDPSRQLLSIGYNVPEGILDSNCYDMLASEARLASFVAIAKGDLPARHWFRLGRSLTPVDLGSALVSWSGSMFEYLMPSLVMRAPAGSLLAQTNRLIVRRQVRYAATLGVPWGISESAYSARDLERTYQYSNFGVPGLGLKRGLSDDTVIAPYATGLATMVDAAAAAQNYAALEKAGARGVYGYYEALDYTPARRPEGEPVAVVRAYMAHHQGMTLVALLNALCNGIMRAYFHAEPIVQATELLLQERTPRGVAVAHPRAEEVHAAGNVREIAAPMQRQYRSPHSPVPRTHLLSNGRYAVMITSAGSGYSRWRDLAVTRWREDTTCDAWGAYVCLRDAQTGEVWSAGYQPSGVEPDAYEVRFFEDRAEIHRHDGTIATILEVAVSPEDDAEVRRVSLSNLGTRVRDIDLTSYAELVLAPPAADSAHPVFSKLFVYTEVDAHTGALLATRRRRSPDEPEVWAAHLAVVEGETVGDLEFETDRARFLGRGREIRAPIAVVDGHPLSGTVGAVLDPIFSLRRRVRLAPGATTRVAFWTLVASSRAEVLSLIDKHQDATAFDRTVTLAWTQAQVQLHHLGIDRDEAHLFQRLANHVIYSDSTLRPSSSALKRDARTQAALWPQGISGDLPIVLVRIDDVEDVAIVRQLLRAHQYWRMKQLAVDLVILNERSVSYAQELQASLEALVRASQSRSAIEEENARGNVIVLRADLMTDEARGAIRSAARAVLLSRRGGLAEQGFLSEDTAATTSSRLVGSAAPRVVQGRVETVGSRPNPVETELFNGLGGFAANGKEYVTVLGEGQWTPAPWINVIANPTFGFQVSVEGGGYTWSANSRERQITPWSNDPIGDRPGEVLYVRDQDSGELWTPTALPIREEAGHYVVAHGQGYSRFERVAHGIALELLQFVALEDPIKIARLTIRNQSGRKRRLSVTAYVEWVLGNARAAAAPCVVTEVDPASKVMLARNPWSIEYGSRVACADLGGRQTSWTGDRREFLGRHGTLDQPAALAKTDPLSKHVGMGLDPCGALQTSIELAPHSTTEIVFLLGEEANNGAALALVKRYRAMDLDAVLARVTRHWDDVLGTVQVRTPDRAMDILLNRWLLYQTLVCRVWARSAFYQAGGAYGFRDQLQDVAALALAQPQLTRAHLLRAAARQFAAGDVQHWWLPSSGQGVRTRMSDDLLWLPYVTAEYVTVTGDVAILNELVPFLEGPALQPGEHESFFQALPSETHGTLFEHCARALDASLSVGTHGLPLIGGGDWNDGMNRVGEAGRGESVWLGWFLHATIAAFAPFAEARGDHARASAWHEHSVALRGALERDGWDGAWYRRGYYDDGTPLGSATSDECRIDSIAQSWAVISGAADGVRAARAMTAVDEHLVRREDGLVLLFTPPFDRTAHDPGYIKGYPPGIRENGGQYTHAAIWSAIAFAHLGDGDRAAEVLSILNPIHHASSRTATHRYKVEPYVVSADIYGQPPHVGRGGWTWYTGSAAWMYRAGLEWILGLRVQGTTFRVDPCIPRAWPSFEIDFRHGSTRYEIRVTNPHAVNRGVTGVALDGAALQGGAARIPLIDDGATHQVCVTLG
jgi:cyclic beta-1,2-glucan synthetase